jgi:hypothetical protein
MLRASRRKMQPGAPRTRSTARVPTVAAIRSAFELIKRLVNAPKLLEVGTEPTNRPLRLAAGANLTQRTPLTQGGCAADITYARCVRSWGA